jgi:translation initiation factor 1A
MAKTKGGAGHKRARNSNSGEKQLLFKEDEQEYAIVLKALGDRRFLCRLLGGKKEEILARARGKLRNQKWKHMILVGGHVLVSYREFQDDKCEIIHTYTDKEVRDLISHGEIEREQEDEIDGVIIGDDEDQMNSELVDRNRSREAFSKNFEEL